MRTIQILPSAFLLATILFALPVHASAGTASISIVDVHHFDPAAFKFPGSTAQFFHPDIVSVSQGGTVTWTNNGYENHTVTSYTTLVPVTFEGLTLNIPMPDGKFDSLSTVGPILSGQTFTLNTHGLAPGDHKYFCQIHPWMRATLNIATTGPSTASVNMDHHSGSTSQWFSATASWGFTPQTLQVQKGTVITVTNDGIIPHTITSYTLIIPVQINFKTIMIPIPDGVFDSGPLIPGQSFTLDTSKLQPGTFTFHCDIHPWMLGTLKVSS